MNFVISDIHGNFALLWSLLNQEGLVDDEENLTDLGKETTIVSIGDLLNAVMKDITGDEMVAHVAKDWFDFVLVGNHEWPYLEGTAFNGYYAHPPLVGLYNSWFREGFVKPAFVLGNTLISHAGLVYEDFETADEAMAEIQKAWEEGRGQVWDAFFNAVGYSRGGSYQYGGLLWSDWNEPKNKKFSQIVGHTPDPYRVRMHVAGHSQVDAATYVPTKDERYTLCIDTACKGGGVPSGAWINDDGTLDRVVTLANAS